MSGGGQLVFLICGLIALVSAVLTVSLRSPLRAAVALLAHILSLAGLYLTLHAHLLAAIQLLVYAGAVVVLFVFVIMLIGPSAMPTTEGQPRGLLLRVAIASLMAMVGGTVAFGVSTVDRPYVDIDQCAGPAAECGQFGGVEALGHAIYQQAAVPFELVGILLLVAIIAAVAVARGHTPEEKRAFEERARKKDAEAAAAAE
ncbi:MAG TPA: NADH-quinone oxidoreductase subunit J [Sandaracinaceae bacterium LLY-WYZ-13_1]|nr:NADH-quinone oxidoreductase subunit J [Sandaracinaceae bacterium LLY-WYZ-13_1]